MGGWEDFSLEFLEHGLVGGFAELVFGWVGGWVGKGIRKIGGK